MAVYLDHNSTSPPRREVVEAMAEAHATAWGNASSPHSVGAAARYAIEKARRRLAKLIGAASPEEIVFTSGASEANNLALRGVCFAARRRGSGNHLIVSATEHKAVLDTAFDLRERHGFELTILPVGASARVRVQELRGALRPTTVLVSIIAANNEVGSINPIRAFADVVHDQSRARFHTDAVQLLGREPLNVVALGADLVSLNGHKIGGPKGAGALYRREGVEIDAQISGGGQEQGLRAGTEDAPSIVGFVCAAELAVGEQSALADSWGELRGELWRLIQQVAPNARRNSPESDSLLNTLHVSFVGIEGSRLVMEMDRAGVAISAGSACSTGNAAPSHVLLAMGLDEATARGGVRFSMGPTITREDVAEAARVLEQVLGEC